MNRPTPETNSLKSSLAFVTNPRKYNGALKLALKLERERDEKRELALELLAELEKQHKFSSGFSDTSTKTPFAKMQRDTARLIAKAKEVLP